jgi:hypothetical protein
MAPLPGIQFGSGVLFATPTAGNLAVDPTPQEVGIIQNIKMTISGDIKELFGQKQWAVDSAIGKRSIKGTFEFAQMDNAFFNQCFFADVVTAGVVSTAYHELHTIPATPYMVTLVPPSSGVFVSDLGVVNLTTGVQFLRLPTGTPATGQYVVNTSTGAYTFAAADTLVPIAISYTYSQSAVGTTLTAVNHIMGWGPILSMTIPLLYQGAVNSINLPNVRLGKIDLATKQDDYTMLTTDFTAFAGAADNPLNWYNQF